METYVKTGLYCMQRTMNTYICGQAHIVRGGKRDEAGNEEREQIISLN